MKTIKRADFIFKAAEKLREFEAYWAEGEKELPKIYFPEQSESDWWDHYLEWLEIEVVDWDNLEEEH